MKQQNYSNHARYVPLFHFVLFAMVVAINVLSVVYLFGAISADAVIGGILVELIALSLLFIFFYSRLFALRAQDRAIRAEENLRHFVHTGKLLDARLTMRQIIGLRFAGDDEFLTIAQKAAAENISEDDIKKMIRNWKGDHHRA